MTHTFSFNFMERIAKVTSTARELAIDIDSLTSGEYDQWLEFLKRTDKENHQYFNILNEITSWTDWQSREPVISNV